MQTTHHSKISGVAAAKRPLFVLDTDSLAHVAGGGPNGGWCAATAGQASNGGTASAASHAAAGGPNGGWASTNSGPNGGW